MPTSICFAASAVRAVDAASDASRSVLRTRQPAAVTPQAPLFGPIGTIAPGLVRRLSGALLLLTALAGCAAPAPPNAGTGPVGTTFLADRAELPFEEAILLLADAALQGTNNAPPPTGGRHRLVIDPLIDRASGSETAMTRGMVARIGEVVAARRPDLEIVPFTPDNLAARPLILLGAVTPVVAAGRLEPASAPSGTFRIWAVLGDSRSGTILAHPTAWVRADTVDATPTAFFRDSPGWTDDAIRAAYLRTCAGNPGDRMDPTYLAALRAQADAAAGIRAYEAGQPERALAFHLAAAGEPGGRQLRVLNGLYLANRALGRTAAAEASFGDVVELGLERNRLAVKLLFRPGSTEFVAEPAISGDYAMWLRQIATRATERDACLRVGGHASVTGPAAVNDRLSRARADTIRLRLLGYSPALATRTQAIGFGARQPIVGLGTDDLRDALDRRVEFAPQPCGTGVAAAAPSAA